MIKDSIKTFIGRTANHPIAWPIYKACGWLSTRFGRIYGHARFARENTEQDELLTRTIAELFPDLTVANGLFKGLRYPASRSFGSAFLPKLLGSYESELHPYLKEMLSNNYTAIVDIGCAEGYYAVGLGRRLGSVQVYAFDTDLRARQACAAMATFNGVGDRIHIGGFCDEKILKTIPLGSKALVISDCEGYEDALFNADLAQILARHDVIVETHDFINIDISSNVRSVFAKTHHVQSVKSVDDIGRALTYKYAELEKYSTNERRLILSERRPATMEWLIMTPKEMTLSHDRSQSSITDLRAAC